MVRKMLFCPNEILSLFEAFKQLLEGVEPLDLWVLGEEVVAYSVELVVELPLEVVAHFRQFSPQEPFVLRNQSRLLRVYHSI